MGAINLDNTGSGGAITLSSDGTSLLLGGSAVGGGASTEIAILAKTASYTVVAGDAGKIISFSGGAYTATLTAAATLGSGFFCYIENNAATSQATHTVTIDPNASETIDGRTTFIVRQGERVQLVCDGSNFKLISSFHRGIATNMRTDFFNLPQALGQESIAIGLGTIAGVGNTSNSTAIGTNAQAGSAALALGSSTNAGSSQSTALGKNSGGGGSVTASGSGAMALGGSYASGTDSLAAAIANNTSSYGANGANSIAMSQRAKASDGVSIAIGQDTIASNGGAAIGLEAVASGTGSLALGKATDSTGTGSLAVGQGAQATANYNLAIGLNANATAERAIAIGNNGVVAGSTYSTAIGHNSGFGGSTTATGSGATALGGSYASGADSLAAAIVNNTSSYGANATSSIAIGRLTKSNATYGTAIGYQCGNYASYGLAMGRSTSNYATDGIAIGDSVSNLGANSVAIGDRAYTSATGSFALGTQSRTFQQYQFAYAGGQFAALGDAQGSMYILRAATTDATATVLTTDGGAAGGANLIEVKSDQCLTFDGTITAMQNGAQAFASFRIEGLLVNDGGTTTLVNSATTVIDNQSSWGMAMTADNTNNALAITVTGEASHNIRWVANIRTSEVTYA